ELLRYGRSALCRSTRYDVHEKCARDPLVVESVMTTELPVLCRDRRFNGIRRNASFSVKLKFLVVTAESLLQFFERALFSSVDLVEEVLARPVVDLRGLTDQTFGKLVWIREVSTVHGKQDGEKEKPKHPSDDDKSEHVFCQGGRVQFEPRETDGRASAPFVLRFPIPALPKVSLGHSHA
ncbi:MAG: hypothetical protein UY95_C0013G0008, partial [Parcubacteria group bacterium GW2011_GWA2_56_7]